MKKYLLFSCLVAATCYFSCQTGDEKISASPVVRMPINPNGDTELALLMRAMFEDGMRAKAQVQKGEKPDLSVDFEKIHTAAATEPGKAASADYQAFATAYVQAVKDLKNAQPEEVETRYSGMVSACITCHQSLCTGPLRKIQKMVL